MKKIKIQSPLATVGSMPGTSGCTMACFKAEYVPVGTSLWINPHLTIEVVAMPGNPYFTIACFKADVVPVGTQIFSVPEAPIPADSVSLDRFNRINDDLKDAQQRLIQASTKSKQWDDLVTQCQLAGYDLTAAIADCTPK